MEEEVEGVEDRLVEVEEVEDRLVEVGDMAEVV